MKKSLIFLLLLAICFNPLFCQNTPTADFAFSHVTILDVESGELIPQQTVFIKDDKIVAIIPTDQAGTLNPAKFFQQEGEFGVIKEGASADLILLYGNPFEDINNMRKQVGVMVRGKWMTQAEIETRLNEIANSYGN